MNLKDTNNTEPGLVVKILTAKEKQKLDTIVDSIIQETNKAYDIALWNVYESELLKACFYYLAEMFTTDKQNLFKVKEMLDYINVNHEQDLFDIIFGVLKQYNPDSLAAQKYAIFKAMPSHCLKAVVDSCKNRLDTYVNFNYL